MMNDIQINPSNISYHQLLTLSFLYRYRKKEKKVVDEVEALQLRDRFK